MTREELLSLIQNDDEIRHAIMDIVDAKKYEEDAAEAAAWT